jgi:hypothetical protein
MSLIKSLMGSRKKTGNHVIDGTKSARSEAKNSQKAILKKDGKGLKACPQSESEIRKDYDKDVQEHLARL